MADLTPDQAIESLRKLPEAKQREVLGRLTPDVRKGILARLKGNSVSSEPVTTPATWKERILTHLSPLTDKQKEGVSPMEAQAGDFALGAANAIGNFVLHPIDSTISTAKLIGEAATAPMAPLAPGAEKTAVGRRMAQSAAGLNQTAQDMVQEFKEHPAYAVGQQVGPLIAGELVGDVGSAAKDKLRGKIQPGVLRRTAQRIIGVGEPQVREAVEKAATEAKEDRVAALKKNRENAKEHTAKAAEVKEQNQKTVQAHHNRAERETELAKTSQELEKKIDAAKVKAKADNDIAWDKVREKTAGKETDITPLKATVEAAAEQADPATSPIFKSILMESPQEPHPVTISGLGEVTPEHPRYAEFYEAQYGTPPPLEEAGGTTNFNRLHRWYSYITNRMYSGGRIEGGTYHALGIVRNALNNAMEKIAKESDATKDLKNARESHTQMMETFSDSPNQKSTVASKFQQETTPEHVKEEQRAERLKKVARYDPEIESLAKHAENLQEGIKSLPKSAPLREQIKPLPPKPETIRVQPTTVDLPGVRKELVHKFSKRLALSGYDAGILASSLLAHPLIHFLGQTGEALRVGAAGYVAGKAGVRAALESQRVIEWLSKTPPREVEIMRQIPGADRIKIVDGLTKTAVDASKKGRVVRLTKTAIDLLGPRNVALIASAAAANRPKTAGEAKKRAQELRLSTSP